jgi:hypothetical protein
MRFLLRAESQTKWLPFLLWDSWRRGWREKGAWEGLKDSSEEIMG